MLDKTWEGSWALYCDGCGAYFSDLLDPEHEPAEVICQECLDRGDEDLRDADDWREISLILWRRRMEYARTVGKN